MENLQTMKCKNCGASLNMSTAENGVIKCGFCRSVFTVAKKETSPAAISSLRIAENELDTCSFDRAYTSYKKAAELDKNEPEAYFGMALAEFKVQFLKDVPNNRLQPICHEISNKKFTENANYKKALALATDDQRFEYERNGQEIDYIREEFFKIKKSGLEYDSFICVKVTDDATKQRTPDYKDADDIYFHLRRKGYKPFFSERELRNVTGADYEARILYALYTAECMLVVCNDESYLQTPWVKNEYTRFLKLIGDEEKESDSITIVFNGKPIERLPGKNGRIQGIDLTNREAFTAIAEFVENHTPAARKRREEEKRRKQEEADALKRQIESQIEEQKRAQRELEKRLNSLNAAPSAGGGATATVKSLLTRARQELGFKDFAKAKDYFNKVLDADPQNADGWWGLFLVEFGVTDEKEIYDKLSNEIAENIYNSRNYKSAVKYATEDTEKRIAEFTSGIQAADKWWKLFLADFNTTDTDYIIDNVSKEVKTLIKDNVNYQNAVKYAGDEFKPVLESFEQELNSPEAYWKLFLQEFSVKHENELLELLTESGRAKIEKSVNYRAVLKDAQGELRDRVEKFRAAMYSGEVWWKRLLQEFKATSGADLIAHASNKQLFEIPENPYYKNAYEYAKGDFSTIINSFIGELFSFKLWWNRFLTGYGAKEEKELLENFKYEYRNIPQYNQCYRRAKKYASEEDKKLLSEFEQGLAEHAEKYEAAQTAWAKLEDEFGCAKNENAFKEAYKNIAESKNYNEAITLARLSKDRELILKYSAIAKEQEQAVTENCAKRKSKRLGVARKVIVTLTVLICIATALTGILSFAKVSPLELFWVRPVLSFLGSHIWRALIIAVPAFFMVVILIMADKCGLKNGSNIATITISVIVVIAIAFSALAGYVVMNSTDNNESNLIETSNYIIALSEDKETDAYTLESVYFTVKETKTITIPASYNGKRITAIGNSAFKNCKIETINLPDNITSIGDKAFQGCTNLKTLNIPENVEYIGAQAFKNCGTINGSELTVLSFGLTEGWYYTNSLDGSGEKPIAASNISSSVALKFLRDLEDYNPEFYMFRK